MASFKPPSTTTPHCTRYIGNPTPCVATRHFCSCEKCLVTNAFAHFAHLPPFKKLPSPFPIRSTRCIILHPLLTAHTRFPLAGGHNPRRVPRCTRARRGRVNLPGAAASLSRVQGRPYDTHVAGGNIQVHCRNVCGRRGCNFPRLRRVVGGTAGRLWVAVVCTAVAVVAQRSKGVGRTVHQYCPVHQVRAVACACRAVYVCKWGVDIT